MLIPIKFYAKLKCSLCDLGMLLNQLRIKYPFNGEYVNIPDKLDLYESESC
jgi:hypothetical protein